MQPGHLLGQRLQTQADSECSQAWDSSFVHTDCDLWHGRPGAYVSQHLRTTHRYRTASGRFPWPPSLAAEGRINRETKNLECAYVSLGRATPRGEGPPSRTSRERLQQARSRRAPSARLPARLPDPQTQSAQLASPSVLRRPAARLAVCRQRRRGGAAAEPAGEAQDHRLLQRALLRRVLPHGRATRPAVGVARARRGGPCRVGGGPAAGAAHSRPGGARVVRGVPLVRRCDVQGI